MTVPTKITDTGDGVLNAWELTFPYIEQPEVIGYLDGTPSALTFNTATNVSFGTAPGSGVAVVIKRETNIDVRDVDYIPGSVITEANLDASITQWLYSLQEIQTEIGDAGGALGSAAAAAVSAAAAAVSAAAALVSETNAAASEAAAAASAAGVNLPSIVGGDALKILQVNAGETGYEHIANSSAITGEIRMYGGAAAPAGWELCDNTELNRTTEAALFAVIGTSYGVGDGSTTFNVPDFRGRAIIGEGTGPTGPLTARTNGDEGGVETHALVEAELAAHTHGLGTLAVDSGGAHTHTTTLNEGVGAGADGLVPGDTATVAKTSSSDGAHVHTTSGALANTGSGTAHENMMPFGVAAFIIKK
jgi:microcystin-dependent protein